MTEDGETRVKRLSGDAQRRRRNNTETTQKRRTDIERSHSSLGAQRRGKLQPDQSRRWSSGLIGERGAGMRLGAKVDLLGPEHSGVRRESRGSAFTSYSFPVSLSLHYSKKWHP